MKKTIIVLINIGLILTILVSNVKALDNNKNNEDELRKDEIISSQKASLDIGGFINQAKKYTEDIFKDTDYNELLNSAIKGDMDNKKLGNSILRILRKRDGRFC